MILLSSTRAVSSVEEKTNYASVYRKILSGNLDEKSIYKASEKLNFDKNISAFLFRRKAMLA